MKDNTKLTVAGRPHHRPAHPVNTPIERASTYLFPTYDDYLDGAKAITYGRLGTPTHRAFEEAVTALEGGFETRLAPSGLHEIAVRRETARAGTVVVHFPRETYGLIATG